MNDAYAIAIDPYLLCLPEPCNSVGQLEQFVNSLLAWSECLRRPQVRVLVSDACRGALIDDEQYPVQHQLRKLLWSFKIDYVDHETVCRLVQSVLDRTPSLEDACGIRAVLFDDASAKVQPAVFMARLKMKTRAAFTETLVVLSARHNHGPKPTTSVAIASMIDDDQDDKLTIECEIHEVQWHDTSYRASVTLPVTISESFDVFGSHEDFLTGVGVLELWGSGDSEGGARDAISLKVNELIENGTATESDIAEYRFGGQFLESARHWGFGARSDYAMLLIESCARILVDKPKNSVEPFRVDSKPTSAQRVRADGALAFRTHLTKKGAGFRLMLWKTVDGVIEFANVGDKDELQIG